jgi:hypothetical protein
MLALMEDSDQLAALAADPGLLPVAVEELLRLVSPVKNMSRTVTTDVELARLPDLALGTAEPLPYRPSDFVSGLEATVRFTATPVLA